MCSSPTIPCITLCLARCNVGSLFNARLPLVTSRRPQFAKGREGGGVVSSHISDAKVMKRPSYCLVVCPPPSSILMGVWQGTINQISIALKRDLLRQYQIAFKLLSRDRWRVRVMFVIYCLGDLYKRN